MTNDANPAAALRAAMRDLLTMFKETLGDEAGAAALKTAVERALSEVIGATPRRATRPPKHAPKAVAKHPPRKPAPAPKAGKRRKAKPSAPSPGRLRQIAAMKAYWRKKKAEAAEEKEASSATA